MFDHSLVKTNGGGTDDQSDSLLIDVLLSKTPLFLRCTKLNPFEGEKQNMLKSEFVPYSEKLRQSVERRRAANINGHQSDTTKSIEVGHRAPDFTLYNTEHQTISLHDSLKESNVVLIFFPLAFTDVCTEELCSIRDKMQNYHRLDAKVLAISVDSMFALKKFKDIKGYQFDLLSDFNKTVSRDYNVLYDDFPLFQMKGVTKRAAFVIDRHGVIQHLEILSDPGRIPDFHVIEQVLEKLSTRE